MSSAKITLFSFAQWMQMHDKDLFSEMILPEGVDKDTLTDNILIRGGEFEVIYAQPDFMQRAIGSWSKKWYRTFAKWVEALDIEYNPLENYDRMEDFTDTTNRGLSTSGRKDSGNTRTFDNEDKETRDYEDKETRDYEDKETRDYEDKETRDITDERTYNNTDERTHNNTDERTHNNTDERTLDTSNVLDGTTEEKVSAFDSSTYQPSRQNETDNTTTDTGTITDAHTGTITDDHTGTITDDHTGTVTDEGTGTDTFNHTGTDTLNHTGTDTFNHTGTDTFNHTGTITDEYGEGTSGSEKENTKYKHGGRAHGNIGVTSSQELLKQQLEISAWNLYEHITDIFLEEFIIPIYS